MPARPNEGGIEHEFWEVNGIRMHVATTGSGPPIILLHGFPELWYSWRHLIPRLAENFRVIAPDLRGYGRTEIPDHGYDLGTLGRDVLGLIEQAGGKAVLVGHDWGGVVGWHVAAAYPDRVSAYVTVAGPHPARYFELLVKSPRQLLMSLYVFFFQIPFVPERLLSARRGRALARLLKRTTVRPGVITDEDIGVYREAWSLNSLRAGISYYRQLARRPLWALRFYRAHPVACPVCVVWADRDLALSLAQTAGLERWCERPPEVQVIRRCGHWIPQEAPDELYRIMMEFIRKVEQKR